MTEYVVPPARLNVAFDYPSGCYSMPHSDDTYPVPIDWLKANAKRFHFTDAQILDAAVTEFEAPNLSFGTACTGIYFLIQAGEIVYVGLSVDIPGRLDMHREAGKEFDSFAWFEAPDHFLREIEAYYIHRIKPILNINYPIQSYFREIAQQFDTEPPKKRVRKVRVITPLKAFWALSPSPSTKEMT